MKTARWTVRVLLLVVFSAFAALAHNPARLHGILPACSPFLALITLAAGGASLILLPAVLFAVIAIYKRRFFCRWICPAGTCFEMAGSKLPRRRWISRAPRLGIWFLALGLGAALAGFPLFLVLDPLAVFSSAFGWLRPQLTLWEKAGACVFPALIVLAAAAPWFWCAKLCPLGALQDAVGGTRDWMLAQRATARSPEGVAGAADTGRRLFLGLGVGAVYRLLINPAVSQSEASVIRPPLCGGEARFTRLCARCGACARACPEQIIIQSDIGNGFAGVLAPELDFSRAGCAPDCTHCGAACPTGAIPDFTIADKLDHPLGVAVIDVARCVLSDNRECGVCMNACPHGAINIVWEPVEMVSALDIDETLCTGCGICQYLCPERPVAITVKRKIL